MSQKVEIVAHRGNGADVLENTLAAVEQLVRWGRTGIEIDVHLTKDGSVVLHHDHFLLPHLTRHVATHAACRETAAIEDMTLAELGRYEFAEAVDAAGMPISWRPIPLLADVLDIWKDAPSGHRLYVEMKTSPEYPETRTDPAHLTEAVLALVEARKLQEKTALLAFDWRGLARARELGSNILRCHLSFPVWADLPPLSERMHDMVMRVRKDKSIWCGAHDPDRLACSLPQAVAEAGGYGWAAYYADLNAENVADAHNAGVRSMAWTVNSKEDLARMVAIGVQTIITDKPEAALDAAGQR